VLAVIYRINFNIKLVFLSLVIGTNIIFAQEDFLYSPNPILHDIIFKNSTIDLFPKMTPIYIYKIDEEYRLTSPMLKINNKIRKLKRESEEAEIEGCFIIYERYDDFNLKTPLVISYDYYATLMSEVKLKSLLRQEGAKRLSRKTSGNNYGSKAITLMSQDIGGTNLSLNIDGNISISGKLIFEDKDLVNLNSRDSKSWDLDIDQTQRFNIEGKVGDKLSIKVKQDSEADFDFQNNMIITYDGDDNDIIKEVQAGNINLNLPSTQFVNVGSGKSEGLFGVKMVNQFGPLEVQGILSRQQVKKASKSFTPGQSSEGTYINDYNFIKDRYFFIDDNFKSSFYPLNSDLQHTYYQDYVIYKIEVFKRVINIESGLVPGTAYLNPLDSNSYNEGGSWVRLEEGSDYEVDQVLGYIRFKSLSSQDVIGVSYEIGSFDGQQINQLPNNPFPNNTIFYDDYIQDLQTNSDAEVTMKLIKAQGQSTPNSPTWPLMFKNVYSLGGSNISVDELEVEIAYIGGILEEETHSQINDKNSFLHLFGLDVKDQNNNDAPSGDGIIDYQYSNIINAQYGELFFPTYLPFAYDPSGVWGTDVEDIGEVLNTSLEDSNNNFSDESDDGPSMYYSTNNQSVLEEHEFVIKVKHSESLRSSTINLGFMIVEGSEEIRLNGQTLISGTDYTIDYFTGTLNIINQQALDPTANLDITYEENELLSFDQKVLAGLHFKYDYADNDYLSGGLYYYNQSIVDERVDFGFEPMRNFIWNISGKYDNKAPLLTDLVNTIPLIETNKTSNIFLEGEYAQVYPNPNPIGEAFLDDFESSKRTSSPSIIQRYWKKSSAPIVYGDSLSVLNRGRLNWYNPYIDLNTQDIWPQQDVSNQANNTTTKTLFLQTNDIDEESWGGITTQLYSSDFDQSQSKYLDIWINTNGVQDNNLMLNIDIGFISEDMNNNGLLDTEDQDIYGPGLGDGILSDDEDIGLDGCIDDYETGWGGCIDESLNLTFSDCCSDSNLFNYINPNLCGSNDPNNDNWSFDPYAIEDSKYDKINGTEGNGLSTDYRKPDTEDLDNDKNLDMEDDYFSYKINVTSDENLVNQTYTDSGSPTGWKLFRILLADFYKESSLPDATVNWEEVRSMRLWTNYNAGIVNTEFVGQNLLKIAKIEIVGNEWEELGKATFDNISMDSFEQDSTFAITVINTQDNSEYQEPPGVIGEYDEYNNIRLKEQSLVLNFYPNDSGDGGIESKEIVGIKKILTNLTNDNKDNFFAYNFMEMFVYGNPLDTLNTAQWFDGDSSKVDLFFRLGKDDNFYELRQPIYSEWDSRNHVKVNLDELTRFKLNIESLDEFEDTGPDGVYSFNENGCFDIDSLPYGGYLPSGFTYNEIYIEALELEGENFFEYVSAENQDLRICGPMHWDFYGPGNLTDCMQCSDTDPNGDNFQSLDIYSNYLEIYKPSNEIDEQASIVFGFEGDNKWQQGEPLIDYNGNNIFDYPANYNENQELWYWDYEDSDISLVCNNCTEFLIKGEPAINRIEYVIVGVANNLDDKIFGKVYLDELRLTGVKKDQGSAFRLKGSVDFADLLNLNLEYKNEDADFHRLEERLGEGDSEDFFSMQTRFNPDLFLPSNWGVQLPVNLNFSSLVKSPKYYPTQPDVLTEGEGQGIPDSIKSISRTISLSSSFNKRTKSDNWLVRSTLDNLSLNYSVMKKTNSSIDVRNDRVNSADFSLNYSFSFDKENYWMPFKGIEEFPFFGKSLYETKIYYSPEKFSTSMNLSESQQDKTMRTGIETNTYDLGMNRSFLLNYKLTDNLKSNYKKNVSSDLDFIMNRDSLTKYDLFKNFSPGLVKSISEDLSNTFSPDLLKWLDPTIKYNPNYTWNISNQSDSIPSATIENKTYVETSFNLSPKEFVEVFYKPNSKNNSKKKKGRNSRRGSSKKTNTSEPLFNIENEKIKKVFDGLHDYASKISKITIKYTYNAQHRHSNVLADQFIDYNYRLGLVWTPSNLIYNNSNELISSYLHNFNREFRFNVPTLTVIPNLSLTSIEYKNKTSNSLESASSADSSRVVSYLPMGVRGNEGVPMISWGLTWTGFEKNELVKKYFKSFKLSHNYKGEMTESFIDTELQKRSFAMNFAPLIKLDARTKGENPMRLELGYKYILNIDNEGTTTEREYKNIFNSKLEFSRSKGMDIPLLGSFSNNISFAINLDWEYNYTLLSTQLTNNLDDFNLQSESTVLSFKPNISYNFSKYVNGNVFYNYILTKDLTYGKSKENDFGFTVNIKIQG
tara:strand:- start:175 stop:6948 length:6774 start_codon:yes stop_codon:yes gene_type:complete